MGPGGRRARPFRAARRRHRLPAAAPLHRLGWAGFAAALGPPQCTGRPCTPAVACMRACVRAWRACVRGACVRACVARACVHACVAHVRAVSNDAALVQLKEARAAAKAKDSTMAQLEREVRQPMAADAIPFRRRRRVPRCGCRVYEPPAQAEEHAEAARKSARRAEALSTEVHPCHICTGTGTTPATSAPGPGACIGPCQPFTCLPPRQSPSGLSACTEGRRVRTEEPRGRRPCGPLSASQWGLRSWRKRGSARRASSGARRRCDCKSPRLRR